MEKICSELDAIQVSKVFLLLLSKDYVNQNAAKEFQLTKDLPVEFLLNMACVNATKIKKVAIVKEYLASIVEHVDVTNCADLEQLKLLAKYIDINSKMLIQGHPKIKKFMDTLARRIDLLTKNQENSVGKIGDQEDELMLAPDVSMNQNEKDKELVLLSLMDKLQAYYDDEILGTLVDLV
jgi:hypothetical protein